jgi:quinoprotein relay system zinc metallohydrolase 2
LKRQDRIESVSRRRSIKLLAWAAASPCLPAFCSATHADDISAGAQTLEIADGVYVHQGRHGVYDAVNLGDICNTGFIVGRDAVAVVDTGGTARLGAALLARIRRQTDRPIRYVINTHMHPDHVLGNAPFLDAGATIVAHEKLAAALSARGERYLAYNAAAVGAEAFAGTKVVLPTLTVNDQLTLDLGDRTLALQARPTAHTDNDLTIRDSATATMFVGDLIFSGHVPTLDGSIRGWLALLGEMTGEPLARIVPGHGPPAMSWPDAATPVRRYLGTIADGVRKAISAGMTIDAAMDRVAAEERPHWQLFDEFHKRNVSAAFAELEWE